VTLCSVPADLGLWKFCHRRSHTAVVEESTAVEQFKALGDPVRWAIVGELRVATRSARVLADAVAISPTLLSHHLRVLREAGLVSGSRRGRWIDYSIDSSAILGLAEVLERR
jgi:ArsR family transcriptional regulator, arsenate/arsenite/antimonite-responsive transcriptional repressor